MTQPTPPPAAPVLVERPIEILLIEDDPGDVVMTREAYADHKLRNTLHVVDDGVQAMAFLRQEGEYADRARPDLVLLDLNLPGLRGQEVLCDIKQDPALLSIPVVVLTSSGARQDVLDAYAAHANSYVVKPADFDQFLALVGTIQAYWLTSVLLPTRVG